MPRWCTDASRIVGNWSPMYHRVSRPQKALFWGLLTRIKPFGNGVLIPKGSMQLYGVMYVGLAGVAISKLLDLCPPTWSLWDRRWVETLWPSFTPRDFTGLAGIDMLI